MGPLGRGVVLGRMNVNFNRDPKRVLVLAGRCGFFPLGVAYNLITWRYFVRTQRATNFTRFGGYQQTHQTQPLKRVATQKNLAIYFS